ncbi:MAG: tRNA 4-thiouridine(8) synthase ThiI [Thermodesulfobacteriota bacterium]
MIKALALFSGGLDSILAVKLLQEQDVMVKGICFDSLFFPAQRAWESAGYLGLSLSVVDITEPMLDIVRRPRHGYGKRLNPCIDCHALMFRLAGEMLEREGACFMISGEVLGQRPMSQNRRSIAIISRESGFEGEILRPLSAKKLPETHAERQGWVNREKLLDLSGRSRKPQIEMAKRYGLTEYPAPAGGCLLTEAVFSRRLKDLIVRKPEFSRRDVELLKYGRHFRISGSTKIVVGRDQRENETIVSLSRPDDALLRVASFPGPTVLLMGSPTPEKLEVAAKITVSYSDAPLNRSIAVGVTKDWRNEILYAQVGEKNSFHRFLI